MKGEHQAEECSSTLCSLNSSQLKAWNNFRLTLLPFTKEDKQMQFLIKEGTDFPKSNRQTLHHRSKRTFKINVRKLYGSASIFTSVSDPDPSGSVMIRDPASGFPGSGSGSVLEIRIRIQES